ncbi:MAG: M16 family metallopeptidase [Muribaculaceae bacterium]
MCSVANNSVPDYSCQPHIHSFSSMCLNIDEPLVLPNGVRIFMINGGAHDINRMEVAFGGGSFDESKPMEATLMAAMTIHGNATYPSRDVAEKLDFCGSWFNSRCLDHHTTITLHSLNRCFADILPMFADIIMHPAFPEKEFALNKEKMSCAYRTARDKVKYLANIEASRLFFGASHPLARDITDAHFDAISTDDLRAFHHRYYQPQNCTIVLSGRITDDILNRVTDTFSAMPAGYGVPEPHVFPLLPSSTRYSAVHHPGAVQSGISMFLPAPPRSHSDYIKLRVLIMALGGYFGSRLMSNVREDKGYTYGISASLLGRASVANIAIATECDNAYVEPLIHEVRSEISRLSHEPIPLDELNMVKQFIMSDLAKTLETPFSIASYVDSTLFFGVAPDYFNRQVAEIAAVTPQELMTIAQKYLNADDATTVVVGDNKK